MTLAEMLRVARQESGLTQTQLSGHLRIKQAQISKVELGQKNTRLEHVDAWMDACGYRLVMVPSDTPSVEEVEALSEKSRDLVLRLARVVEGVPEDGRVALEALLGLWEARQESSSSAMSQDSLASLPGLGNKRAKSS